MVTWYRKDYRANSMSKANSALKIVAPHPHRLEMWAILQRLRLASTGAASLMLRIWNTWDLWDWSPYCETTSPVVEVKLIIYSTLVKTPHSEEFLEYVEEEGIEHFRIIIPAHKTPSSTIPIDTLLETLRVILNHKNYPLLIHCNKGKVPIKSSVPPW